MSFAHPPKLEVRDERWPIAGSFRISRGAKTEAHVVVCELTLEGATGRGECVPYARYGESVEGVLETIRGIEADLRDGLDRLGLQRRLPAGAARNALDCAFWDLEAKRGGHRVWELLGLDAPEPVVSAYSLSLDTPEKMGEAAREHAARPLLKLKLSGPEDLERVRAVRNGAPQSEIIVDANEGWDSEAYRALVDEFQDLGVAMIEQPFPAGEDEALRDLPRPIPVCADESCHDTGSLAGLKGKYDMVNIKLDKTGGLTEALKLKRAAEAEGFQIMVGCMLATSLAMAPALLVAQDVAVVDLDGPLLLAKDRPEGLGFGGSRVYPPEAALWG